MNQRLAALQGQIADAASPEDRQERANASLSRYLVGPIKVLSRENPQKSHAALPKIGDGHVADSGKPKVGHIRVALGKESLFGRVMAIC